MFAAGVLQDAYPLRHSDASERLHSLNYRASDLRKLRRQFARYGKAFQAGDELIAVRSERVRARGREQLSIDMVAREFARFAYCYESLRGRTLTQRHLESAFGLVHRWLECVPGRRERIEIAGLAAAALAASGMRVHLILENDRALAGLQSALLPVFERMEYTVGSVKSGIDEHHRTAAYQQQITLVSARECAMDFLRDSVKWPGKGNPVERKLDTIMGGRSHLQSSLMRGLPCAILIDADSTLVDNARAPIALTRDAHPMHETDAIKQALEMVEHLQAGQHYELIGEGAEVALTDLGLRQLQAWADELGGVWSVEEVAQLMLAVAIVVKRVLVKDAHYRLHRQQVEWMLDERLIPGMKFYSELFLSRVVALNEDCKINEQREVAARSSYQQIFNRYIHLCGMSHSSRLISREFHEVYGLKLGQHWPERQPKPFHQIYLLRDEVEKMARLSSELKAENAGKAILLLALDAQALAQLQAGLQADFPHLVVLNDDDTTILAGEIKSGAIILALNNVAEYQAFDIGAPFRCPLMIISTQRSPRYSEDVRALFWMQNGFFSACERRLLLSIEDELFSETSLYGFQNMVRFSTHKIANYLIERRIRRIQRVKARSLFQMRQQLLAHDETMQGLLSFSGRGLYE